MDNQILRIRIIRKVDTCPTCGYIDGFHVSFDPLVDRINIVLARPECHGRFDPYRRMKKIIRENN